MIRNMCERPQGNFRCLQSKSFNDEKMGRNGILLLEIPELVTPLGRDSERIFKESDDNQETSQGR